MKIRLSSSVIKHFPGINYTVILIKNVNNLRKISNLGQLVRGAAVVAKNELKKIDKKDLLTQVTEQALEDGSIFTESYVLGAKIKKIQNGKDIEGKDNLTNLVNLLSLKYFLPLHGADLDEAETDLLLDLYQPKKGKKTPELDFTSQTKHVAIWFPNLAGFADEEIDRLITEINIHVSKYFSSQISEVYHLDAEHSEVDLGYTSEKELIYRANNPEKPPIPEPSPAVVEQSESTPIPPATPDFELAKNLLQNWLTSAAQKLYPDHTADFQADLETPKDPSHGDWSSNLAMKLTKLIGQAPQAIAEAVRSELLERNTTEKGPLAAVEVVGPGFVNFRLNLDYYQKVLAQILAEKEQFGRQDIGHSEQIMIEFGSLNMAKPFGAHHFLTTIIGQTLVNLHRALNFQVTSADFPGDWGTQFGKTLYAYKQWGDRETIEKDPMNEFLKIYVKFHDEAEKDPTLEDAARAEFRKLETGDSENLELWKWIITVSQRDLDTIYRTLGVEHQKRYPESKYNQKFQEILEQGKQLGLITEGEKGAFVANFEAEKLPTAVIQKADGTSLYITRDLASIKDRLTEMPNLKRLVYVVDSAQSLHFQQLFALANQFHAKDAAFPVTEFKHVPYGRMSFADTSMSTRKGNIIQGRDLITEGYRRSESLIKEKLGANSDFSEAEIKNLTQGLTLGSIKYAMLAQAPESDFVFDWDKVLSFDGNSAPYLQYTQARAKSILRKSTESSAIAPAIDQTTLFNIEAEKSAAESAAAEAEAVIYGLTAEHDLLRELALFPDKILFAAQNYKPNVLSNYLYSLAQTFNSFYSHVPVLKTQRPDLLESRLNLVRATAQVLQNGLNLLGIVTFERM